MVEKNMTNFRSVVMRTKFALATIPRARARAQELYIKKIIRANALAGTETNVCRGKRDSLRPPF